MVMEISIKTLVVVLLTVASFVAAQADEADQVIDLSGTVSYADPDRSEIWIAPQEGETVEIIGFPFHNLEAQLEEELGEPIAIGAGDCVTVTYYVKKPLSKDAVNKWLSLEEFCDCAQESCGREVCTWDEQRCYLYDEGLDRKPQKNKNRPDPWPWHGKPPGHRP